MAALYILLGLVVVSHAYNQHVSSDGQFAYAKCRHLVNMVNDHARMVDRGHWPDCTIPCNAKGSNCENVLGNRYGPGNEYVDEKSEACGSDKIRKYWCYKSTTSTKALKLDKKAEVSGTYWMGFLPDDKPLNEINLPGTHDTSAYGEYLGRMTKTQDKNIQQQLDMGVRFLDLRIRWLPHKKKFVYSHGPTNFLYLPFNKALDIMTSFLRFYDTETIILSFWPEKLSMAWGQTKKVTTKAFKKWWKDPMNPYIDYFYKFQFKDSKKTIKKMPTLGEVRGKIVMMSIEMNKKGFEDIGKYSLVYGDDVIIPHKMWDKHVWEKGKLFHEWTAWEKKYNKRGAGNKFHGISSGANGGAKWKTFGFMENPVKFAESVNPRIKQMLLSGYDKPFAYTVAKHIKMKRIFCGWLAFDFVDYQLSQFAIMTNKEIWGKLRENCAAMEEKMVDAKDEYYTKKEWMSRKVRAYDGSCEVTDKSMILYASLSIAIFVLSCIMLLMCLFGAICGYGMSKMMPMKR